MEKISPTIEGKKDTKGSYDAYHAEARKLLGKKYDEQKVNGCMALQAPGEFEKAVEELERDLEGAKDEPEKNAARNAWLEKYDVMRDITH